MNGRPLQDRVVIRRNKESVGVTDGGIYIPDQAQEKPQEGIILAVGEGRYLPDGTRQPVDVAVGDRVLFGKFAGSDVRIDGEDLLLMREDEILMVLPRLAETAGTPIH